MKGILHLAGINIFNYRRQGIPKVKNTIMKSKFINSSIDTKIGLI